MLNNRCFLQDWSKVDVRGPSCCSEKKMQVMDENHGPRQLSIFSSCTKARKLQWSQDWLLVAIESLLLGP